jgi:endonuclease/exonuclease/phosphatase family metal-dependent hydrolase
MTAMTCDPIRSKVGCLAGLCAVVLLSSGCIGNRSLAVRILGGKPADCVAANNCSSSVTLKVTTFNVWGLPSWVTGASPSRFPRIADELARTGSDVVALQEVWTRRSFEALVDAAPGTAPSWWSASARKKNGFLGQNGLLTLSRHPSIGGEFRPFSVARLPDSLMRKGALKVTIAIPSGQRINVWNVHLQDGASKRVRAQQAAELVQWITMAEDDQIADIVAGDYNCAPESEEFRHLVAAIGPSVNQLTRQVALPTWDACRPAHGGGLVLDHIFLRTRQPVDGVCPHAQRVFASPRREDRLSDHMGLEASLKFRTVGQPGPAWLGLNTATVAQQMRRP